MKCLLIVYLSNRARSHLTRGAWIEIRKMTSARRSTLSRTSHEVRGLKSGNNHIGDGGKASRTSHEVRGLKFSSRKPEAKEFKRRTSHEVRGLKFSYYVGLCVISQSHLTRGAWIEIQNLRPLSAVR